MSKAKKARMKEKFIKCGHFMYNKETHYFCAKSCSSWCFIFAFYVIYLAISLGAFFGMLVGMLELIAQEGITGLFDKKNLISEASPALEIIPKLPNYPAPMMWYMRTGNNIKPDYYVDYMDVFLSQYDNLNESIYVDCSKQKRKVGQYCKFTKEDLGPCGIANYGYDEDQPCLYLKLNKLMGWDPRKFRPKMNIDEEERIGNEIIMVTCKALSHYHAEHLGPVNYYPGNGFYEYYFPYDGSKNYLPPLIGVHFPKLKKGFVIGIECLTFDAGVKAGKELLNQDIIYVYAGEN